MWTRNVRHSFANVVRGLTFYSRYSAHTSSPSSAEPAVMSPTVKVPCAGPEIFTSPTFAPARKMASRVSFAGICATGKLRTTNFACAFTLATRPTGDRAGAITRLVWPPAGFTLKAGSEGCLDEEQPAIDSDANAMNAALMVLKCNPTPNKFLTGGERSESASGCHWTFPLRAIRAGSLIISFPANARRTSRRTPPCLFPCRPSRDRRRA